MKKYIYFILLPNGGILALAGLPASRAHGLAASGRPGAGRVV